METDEDGTGAGNEEDKKEPGPQTGSPAKRWEGVRLHPPADSGSYFGHQTLRRGAARFYRSSCEGGHPDAPVWGCQVQTSFPGSPPPVLVVFL